MYNGKLIVVDNSAHRVLIFNSIPTTNGVSADVVIGQTNFTNVSANQGGTPGPNTLNGPSDVIYDNNRLYITDTLNNRILVFNDIPTTNNASADFVIGQKDFTSVQTNQGGTIQAISMSGPSRLVIVDNKLFVTDSTNNRVLVFDNALPNLSLTRNITGQPDGRQRFSGTANTNIVNHVIKQIEYSVNGSTWTGGFPVDGNFDTSHEEYYFDFDPSVNEMADNQGFTVKIRATHNNDKDTGNSTLYFEPFQSTSPVDNTFSLNRLPTFTFNIQKVRFNDLKENLDRFRISISTDGTNWEPYIDHIPVDYNSVRLHPDNLQPNKIDEKNGTYEDKFKTVVYEQENSVISVTPKGVDREGKSSDKYIENGGTLLGNNTYYWRVEALDKASQIQYTDPKTIRVGTRQVVTSRPWFPLAVRTIGGKETKEKVNISTAYPTEPPTYTVDSRWPWFYGIATADSVVTFRFEDTNCVACTVSYETKTRPNSTYVLEVPWALKAGATYAVTASVKDTGDNYNELPPFTIHITE